MQSAHYEGQAPPMNPELTRNAVVQLTVLVHHSLGGCMECQNPRDKVLPLMSLA